MNKNKFESNDKYFTIFIYTILVILIGCIIIRLVFHWNPTLNLIRDFFSSISSFMIGILIAFMVNPLVNYLYRVMREHLHVKSTKVAKVLSILLAYVVVVGFIALCLVYIIPQLISSIADLSYKIPVLFNTFADWMKEVSREYDFLNNNMVTLFLDEISPKILELSTTMASKLIPWLYSVSIAVISWCVKILIAFVVSVYLLSDKKLIFHAMKKILYAFLPESLAGSCISISKNCNQIFTGYIIAKAIDSLIIGVLCFVLMSILQLPYSVLISVIVGITNMIPYFGPYIGAVPGILILTVFKWKYGLIFAVMILALQQFDGLFLGPRLLGNSTGVRPILILFAITFGGAYFGIVGMFLGVPVIAVCQYLLNLLLDSRLQKKNIQI